MDLPVHVRATRVTRKRRSPIFGKGYFVYDVRFRNGEIRSNINPNEVLEGSRYPADYWMVMNGAEAVAGDGIPGPWVDYPYGRPLDG
ncbi:hypothetical protein ACX80W_12160 [Arthrobacter sp. TMN-37]